MDLDELRALVALGESERLEFKKTTGELKDGMAGVCAMLNGKGGRVLFGVTPSGKIIGQEITDNTLQDVAQAIRKLEPPAQIEQSQVPVREKLQVLVLEPETGPAGPYAFESRPYQRIGPTTSRMPQPEYERLLLARTHSLLRWENQPATGFTLEDLDTKEIERTLRTAVEVGRLDAIITSPGEAIDKLHLRLDSVLVRAAVVLFGQRLLPFYPQSVRINPSPQPLPEELVKPSGLQRTRSCRCRRRPPGAMPRALAWRPVGAQGRLPNQAPKGRKGRARGIAPGGRGSADGDPSEAISYAPTSPNASQPRSEEGGKKDATPGGSSTSAPRGITVADLKREHVSHPRNPLIAEVFFRRGLIERWGRGTQKIVELCVGAGQPEPEFEEQAGSVVVRFRPSSYVPPLRVSHDLSERQREILQILGDHQKWKAEDILKVMAVPPAKRTLQDDLSLLRHFGLVESSGRGPSARWGLKPPQSAAGDVSSSE